MSKYKPLTSLVEYIWNGFDAGATEVKLYFTENQLGSLEDIIIKDCSDTLKL